MPSGIVPLTTAAKYGDDQLALGTIETIIEGSTILERLNWIPFDGLSYMKLEEGTLPTVNFRQINASWTKSHGSDTKQFYGVAILGGEYGIDNYLVRVTANKANLEAKQIAKFAKANRMRFEYECYFGNGVTGDGFKSMGTFVTEGLGQLYDNGGAGVGKLSGLDLALELFRNTGYPDAMFMNKTHKRQITNAARTVVTGVSLIDVGTDVFGKKVTSYDGVPFVITEDGMDSSGNIVPLQPFTEASSTSSIYMAKFDDENVSGILGAGGHFSIVPFGEQQAAPQIMGRMEWYPGLASFNKYGLVRYSNITNAAWTA